MKKIDKESAKRAVEKAIGKGKVVIKADAHSVNGHWEVPIEDDNGRPQVLKFQSYYEAEEVCLEFGGQNILTVAAPMELNEFKIWSYKKLFELGHHVKEISLSRSVFEQDVNRKIPYDLPYECGTSRLPGGNKKEKKAIFYETIKTETYVSPKTIYFETPNQLDKLSAWISKTFPAHNVLVDAFVSQNHETQDYCKFKRQKVGDSTKRMELKMVLLNGKDYRRCRIKNIQAAADGLFAHQCKIVPVEKQVIKTEDLCGDFLGL